MTRILVFAGSARTGSSNQQLATVAAAQLREAGASVTHIDLRDHELPLYDGDLEAASGLPSAVQALKELFLAHDGLLIACPEYNGSITPLLKNTLDWISRPAAGEAPLAAYAGKVAGLVSASPGAIGGLRGLVHVRAILSNLGVLVVPAQFCLGGAYQAFAEDGTLTDPGSTKRLAAVVTQLVATTRGLTAG